MKWKNCLKDKRLIKSLGRERVWQEHEGSKFVLLKERPFLVDCFSILNSKASRRVRRCTQVFTGPANSYVRTRETHITETAVLAEIIALQLGLNSDLTRAIALGHDIGHVPFAHVGEEFLMKKAGDLFSHAIFSAIVARDVEREGGGLNLSYETLEGIISHSGGSFIKTSQDEPEEYVVIRIADKVSYIFSDLNDARRHGYLEGKKLPDALKDFGPNQRSAVNHCLEAVYEESANEKTVSFVKSHAAKLFKEIRQWMFEEVYRDANKLSPDDIFLEEIFNCLEKIFPNHDTVMLFSLMSQDEVEILIRDLRALKTYNLAQFARKYPSFSIMEILPYIEGKRPDYENYKLPKSKFKTLE